MISCGVPHAHASQMQVLVRFSWFQSILQFILGLCSWFLFGGSRMQSHLSTPLQGPSLLVFSSWISYALWWCTDLLCQLLFFVFLVLYYFSKYLKLIAFRVTLSVLMLCENIVRDLLLFTVIKFGKVDS